MRILLLNQAFPPDVASTAQHAGDLAAELAGRRHEVTVVSSSRAYDKPSLRFAAREIRNGVRILRVPCSGFGKGARWRRAVDFATFLQSCFLQLMRLPRFDAVISMTSPPLVSLLAALFSRRWAARLILWVMDLNPDEAMAAGWLRERSAPARLLERCLRHSLKRAEVIVALDRFMKERIASKGIEEGKTRVIPPWSHDSAVCYDPQGRASFRRHHGLEGKFVVMYSGNHSPCHPLDTLLAAAACLSRRQDIGLCFIGGGGEFARVQRLAGHGGLGNVLCLPYQPLDQLSASLSAADLHVVVMGDPFVGIVHPCKIYNILRLGIPFLYIGPPQSHVTEMVPPEAVGRWAHLFLHGDVEGVAQCIERCAHSGLQRSEQEMQIGRRFSQKALMPRMVELLENRVNAPDAGASEFAAYAGR
jgi:glycosyltransferase involved in cell wall biosynthesis